MRSPHVLGLLLALACGCQVVAGLDQPLVAKDAAVGEGGGGDAGGPPYRAAVLADQPLVYYRLDETSGTIAKDSSGHGIDATYVGATVLGAAGALKNDPNTGIEFGTTSASVSVPNAFDFPGAVPYAFELWILPESTDPGGTIFEKDEPKGQSIEGTVAFFAPPTVQNKIQIGFERWHQPDLVAYVHQETVGLVAGVYNHLVFTCDGKSAPSMYLNGARYGGASQNPQAGPDKLNQPLIFGGSFRGKLDEIAVYDHELVETRVLRHFQIGKTGN